VNRTMGSLILIDPVTNATVGAVMLDRDLGSQLADMPAQSTEQIHPLILTRGRADGNRGILEILHQHDVPYVSLDDPYITAEGLASAIRVAQLAGLAAVYSGAAFSEEVIQQIEQFLPQVRWLDVPAGPLDTDSFVQKLDKILHWDGVEGQE